MQVDGGLALSYQPTPPWAASPRATERWGKVRERASSASVDAAGGDTAARARLTARMPMAALEVMTLLTGRGGRSTGCNGLGRLRAIGASLPPCRSRRGGAQH